MLFSSYHVFNFPGLEFWFYVIWQIKSCNIRCEMIIIVVLTAIVCFVLGWVTRFGIDLFHSYHQIANKLKELCISFHAVAEKLHPSPPKPIKATGGNRRQRTPEEKAA